MSKKRKIIQSLIIIGVSIGISSFFIPWQPLFMILSPAHDTVQEEIEDAVENHDFEGVILYIEHDGDASTYTAGYNNRDLMTPADEDDLFRIASISKLYIAVATSMLVDEGRLSLEDTIDEMLPDYKDEIPYSSEITLRMLIQHRTGLFNFVNTKTYDWSSGPIEQDDVLQILQEEDHEFEPDKKYKYSNTNYMLLGMIMDEVLGYPHDEYIEERIFDPLELNDTYYYGSYANLNDIMSGYTEGYELDLKANEHLIPGGNMVASISDVGVFLRALHDGSLMTDSEQKIYNQVYWYEHTGLVPGYQSMARYDAETDSIIILFVNTSGGDMWNRFDILYNKITKIIE